jgi:hypothetical protein
VLGVRVMAKVVLGVRSAALSEPRAGWV